MNDDSAELIPFHAINEFMRDDYRLQVVKTSLRALPDLSEDIRRPLNGLIKKSITVPGFRNSEKAPVHKKAGPVIKAFKNSPEMSGAILAAWAEANKELRQNVYELLSGRGWSLLPLEADRQKLPGFFITWPKGEDFDTLSTLFNEIFPEPETASDDINLMVVWVSMRLPYQMVDEEPGVVTGLFGGDEDDGEDGDDLEGEAEED
jgi:hypothetical protein